MTNVYCVSQLMADQILQMQVYCYYDVYKTTYVSHGVDNLPQSNVCSQLEKTDVECKKNVHTE